MLNIRFTSTADAAAEEELTQRLVAYNLAHTTHQPAAPQQPQPLHLFAYDESGALVAGVIGRHRAHP